VERILVVEGMRAAPGVINELIGHDDRACRHAWMNTADRIHGDDLLHAGIAQRADIRAVIDAVRWQPVRLAVAREEKKLLSGNAKTLQRCRHRTVRRRHLTLLKQRGAVELVETGATDDCERDRHDKKLRPPRAAIIRGPAR